MASYLRSIFGSRDLSKSNKGSSSTTASKSHSRSRSAAEVSSAAKAKHLNYIYAEAGSVPPAPLQTTASRERTNSVSAAKANVSSPLRYTYDSNTLPRGSSIQQIQGQNGNRPQTPSQHHSSQSVDSHSSPSKPPLYRTSSHKVGEKPPSSYPLFGTNGSFGSIRSSNPSLHSGSHGGYPCRATPSRTSSSGSVTTQSTNHEPRSVLKHPGYNASVDSHKQCRNAHVSFHNPNRPIPVHMHPLLSYGRIHRAPMSYDVVLPPSSRTVVDRHTHTAIPTFTLAQPATEPPTYGRFILKHEKLPWEIIVTGSPGDVSAMTHSTTSSGNGTSRSSGKGKFYIGTSPSRSRSRSESTGSSGPSSEPVTNLDVLHAIHTKLSARVTQKEWDTLGTGGRAQRKVSRAYEKRCTDMGGGWGSGVRRVDFLGGKTKLVGIEVSNERLPGGENVTIGKLVFSRP